MLAFNRSICCAVDVDFIWLPPINSDKLFGWISEIQIDS